MPTLEEQQAQTHAPGEGVGADLDARNMAAASALPPPVQAPTSAPSGVPPVNVTINAAPQPQAPQGAPQPLTYQPAPGAQPGQLAAPAIPKLPDATQGTPPAPPAPAPGPSVPRQAKPAPVDPLADLKASQDRVAQAEGEAAQASTEVGEAETEGATAEREMRQQQANDLIIRQRLNELDRGDADQKVQAALETARAAKFHTLMEGDTGKRIGLMIATALGGISFDPNHVNQVTKQIDNMVRQNFEQQEREHAELWKDVEATAQAGKQLRADQLQGMADFRLAQAAQLDGVIAKTRELTSMAKNKEAVKMLEANNARLAFARDHMIQEAKQFYVAQAEKKRVDDAQIARDRAAAAKDRATAGNEQDAKVDTFMQKMFHDDEARALGTSNKPGPVQQRNAAKSILNGIEEAVASGDQAAIKAAITSAREQSTRILTGASPTSITAHLVSDLQTSFDKAESSIGSWIGRPQEGKRFVGTIQKLIRGIYNEQEERIRDQKQVVTGKFKTTRAYQNPALRAAGEARINAIFDAPADEKPIAKDPLAEARAYAAAHPEDKEVQAALAKMEGR